MSKETIDAKLLREFSTETSMFLEISELKRLTGAKQRKRMIEWLILNQYPHTVGLDGYPVVLIEVVRQRLGGSPPKPPPSLPLGPNFEGLDLRKARKDRQRPA